MSTDQPDYQAMSPTFWAFIDATTSEAKNILQQYPELLSDQVEKQLKQLIQDARARGQEKIAQTLEERRTLLQTGRQAHAKEETSEPSQTSDFQTLPPAFWSFIDATIPEEAKNILQQNPELLNEQVMAQIDLMIKH